MQKLVEKGKWQDQNKDNGVKLMEMQGSLYKNVAENSCRQRRMEETPVGSQDSS